MTIQMQDRAPIQKTRKLGDGRIAAVARFARSGVYQYTGAEVGRPELATVSVYRAEDEVFSEDAMASFAHKAMTLDHPSEEVNASNWRKNSVGYTEGRVARDGGFVEIPLILADAEAVSAYERGDATELSAGYSCELIWGDGVAPTGEIYQARQVRIRGNHIALVPKGRAGSSCRIGDSAMLGDLHQMELQTHIAKERSKHDLSQAYRGTDAMPWTDALAQNATRNFMKQNSAAATFADSASLRDAEQAVAKARADAAYAKSTSHLNGWRNGGN